MSVAVIDPVQDARWVEFLLQDSRASVFHSPEWLEALRRTYAFEPFVLTTTERGPLSNGLALCRAGSWISRRLVSLPFSDHCDPLVRGEELSEMLTFLIEQQRERRWRSLELRPRFGIPLLSESGRYCLHALDLRGSLEQIFKGFHPSSTQRAVRRAEREGVSYEAGTSDRLLASFFTLLRLTRRRHGLPPQPLAWFRNLIACFGNRLTIHVASQNSQPIASILTLSFKKTMVYKYGGSDASRHPLGGMPFLFWRVIQDAQARGFEELDLGRSDEDQPGLIAFKDHLGARRSTLIYFTYPESRPGTARSNWPSRTARRVFAHLPDRGLDLAGRLLYKHLG